MIRRLSPVLVFAASVAILAAGCGGGGSGPVLTDPTEIITAALKATESAKSVHVDATVDGVVPVTLSGAGSATELTLTGTTAAADADLVNKAARATFSVPAMFGLAGEGIVMDGKTYLKTTLTGPKYKVTDAGSALPIDPTNTTGMVDNLGDFLLKPGVDPVKGEDVSCGGKQCYTIAVDLTSAELAALIGKGATALPVDVAGASLQMTVRVEQQAPNHLAGTSLTVTLPSGKTLNVELTFSKWDEPVTITAPPADQVNAG
jgi:Protein of unknown function (DUF1396).